MEAGSSRESRAIVDTDRLIAAYDWACLETGQSAVLRESVALFWRGTGGADVAWLEAELKKNPRDTLETIQELLRVDFAQDPREIEEGEEATCSPQMQEALYRLFSNDDDPAVRAWALGKLGRPNPEPLKPCPPVLQVAGWWRRIAWRLLAPVR